MLLTKKKILCAYIDNRKCILFQMENKKGKFIEEKKTVSEKKCELTRHGGRD